MPPDDAKLPKTLSCRSVALADDVARPSKGVFFKSVAVSKPFDLTR